MCFCMLIKQDKIVEWCLNPWFRVHPSEIQCEPTCSWSALIFSYVIGRDIEYHHIETMKPPVKQNFKGNLTTAPRPQTPQSLERKISSWRFSLIATSGLIMRNNPYKPWMWEEFTFGFELWACFHEFHKSAVKTIPFTVWRFLSYSITH